MTVDVIFEGKIYGTKFEAIPIVDAQVVSYANVTTYTAPKDVVIYQISVGDPASDTGIIVGGTLIKGLIAGAYYLREGQSVDLKGDFLIIS